MNHYITTRQMIACSPICLLVLLGLTLFTSPVAAQVFDSGPSDSALFDTVIDLPPAPDIGLSESIGGDGLTTQLNVSDGGSVERFFNANSGGEVNISGGAIGSFFNANSGSEVNISGGDVGSFFNANDGSAVNISGGVLRLGFQADSGSVVNIRGGVLGSCTAGSGSVINFTGGAISSNFNAFFAAAAGSTVNLVGTNFVLDGVSLNDSLTVDEAFTIVDRNVTLSGLLAGRTPFSFNLNPNAPVFEPDGDYFDPGATLTVTLNQRVLLGDASGDGIVTFLDIDWFIGVLASGSYLAEADVNQDGDVNFLDITPLIQVLSGN